MKSSLFKNWTTWAVCGWISLLSYGMYAVNKYGSQPGMSADAPTLWPDIVSIDFDSKGYTLLMMVHPQCPCSRASLHELQAIMKKSHEKARALVLFYHPSDAEPEWSESSLWEQASTISNVQVIKDSNGIEASNFGVYTSGQVLLYDKHGHLRFSGGITPSRGHTGDSAGKSAILKILAKNDRSERLESLKSLVFGCSIHGSDASCKEGYCPNQDA